MKVYRNKKYPEGIGGGISYDDVYQSGYTAGYEDGYADREQEIIESRKILYVYIDDFPDERWNSEPCGYWDDDAQEWIDEPCPWDGKGPYSDEWVQHFYGFDNIDEYLDWFCEAKENAGCNKYMRVRDDFVFEGETYYLFQRLKGPNDDEPGGFDEYSPVRFGLMRKNFTKSFVQSKAIANDHNNIYDGWCPFEYFLMGDGEVYEPGSEFTYSLVDVEYEGD